MKTFFLHAGMIGKVLRSIPGRIYEREEAISVARTYPPGRVQIKKRLDETVIIIRCACDSIDLLYSAYYKRGTLSHHIFGPALGAYKITEYTSDMANGRRVFTGACDFSKKSSATIMNDSSWNHSET